MEEVGKYPGLKLRGSTWYLRVRVPTDLLDAYAPRKEIWRSLRTQDRSEALQRYRLEMLRFDQELADKRREKASAPKTTSDISEIERKVELYFNQLPAWDDDSRLKGLSVERLEEGVQNVDEALKDFRRGVARNDPNEVRPEIEEFLEVYPEIKVEQGSETYQRMVRAIYRANIRSLEVVQARNQGQIVETPRVGPLISEGPKLSEAFERWAKEHHGPRKTRIQFWARIERFISMHGDLPVKVITKAHVREFKDAMMAFPARPPNEVRKLPVRQVIELYRDRPEVPRLKPQSINEGALAALRAVLEHAVSEGFIDHNPALKIGVKVNSNAEPSRGCYVLLGVCGLKEPDGSDSQALSV